MALRRAATAAGRLRRSPTAAPLRRHAFAGALVAAAWQRSHGRRTSARLLAGAGLAGMIRSYLVSRRLGAEAMTEQMARMRRLRPSVLKHFYVTCIASMEVELQEFPRYDQRKHDMRYRMVSDLAAEWAPDGGVVVDVGCASGIVLDRVHQRRGTVGIGFDLSPHGVRYRHQRPSPPVMAQAVVEDTPLRDGIADVVVFSEVIEHLIDAAGGMREVGRITRLGGHLILTTNNASETPERSLLHDPLLYIERLIGRKRPGVLSFRNITWMVPINREADPLPDDAPTYAPHIHYAAVELRRLAEAAGFESLFESSFEFPVPQSLLAARLRRLSARLPAAGDAASDVIERIARAVPGLNLMGTHNLMVFRKVRETPDELPGGWWSVQLPLAEDDDLPLPGHRVAAAAG